MIGTKCCRDREKEREERRGMDPERQRWREGDRDTERRIEIQRGERDGQKERYRERA